MRVAVLLRDPQAILKLHSALALVRREDSLLELRPLDSWQELEQAAGEEDFRVAFVQPDFGNPASARGPCIRELARLGSLNDPARFILYACGDLKRSETVSLLAQFRFPFLIFRDLDDNPSSLLRILARAQVRCCVRERLRPDPELSHLAGSDFLTLPLAGWPPPDSIQEHARRVGLSPRSLYRRHRELRIPTPDRLARWGELFEATALWHLGVRPVGRVAFILGNSGVRSIERFGRGLTGWKLSEIFEPEAETWLWEAFLRDLAA
ncbi:MAG: hypothetical protein R6T96_15025 [Longimicrobiales bacterium]